MSDDRVIRELAERLARIDRELHALSTAPRANHTSVQNGVTRWLDAEGNESVVIGELDGQTLIRVMNADRSAPAFEVAEGVGVFPSGSFTWQRNYRQPVSSRGAPVITVGFYTIMFKAIVPLTTDVVRVEQGVIVTGGSTADVEVAALAMNARAGHVAQGGSNGIQVQEWTGVTGTPSLQADVTIPPSIWDPAADPVGTMLMLIVRAKVTAGGGSIEMGPNEPAYCV